MSENLAEAVNSLSLSTDRNESESALNNAGTELEQGPSLLAEDNSGNDLTAQEKAAALQRRVDELKATLQEKETVIQAKETVIQEKEAALQAKETVIQEKETVIQEKETALQAKETVIQAKEAVIQEKEAVIQEKEAVIQEKEAVIQEKEAVIQEKEAADEYKGLKINEFYLDFPAFKPFRRAVMTLFNNDGNDPISRRAFSLTRYGIISTRIIRDYPEKMNYESTKVALDISVPFQPLPRFLMPNSEERDNALLVLLKDALNLKFTSLEDIFARCFELVVSPLHGTNCSTLVKSFMNDTCQMEGGPSSCPGEIRKNRIWDEILLVCLLFKYSDSSLPEEQYRAGLWAKLIQGFMIHHLGTDQLGFRYEYRIRSFESSYGRNQSVDIAVVSNTELGEIPILLCEVSAHPTGHDDHKDHQKLANEMHAVLWRTVELFKQGGFALEDMNLTVYGLYISALEYQVCTMRPVFDNVKKTGKFVAIFQTEKHWKFSLTEPIINCDAECPSCKHVNLSFYNIHGKEENSGNSSFEVEDQSLTIAYQNVDAFGSEGENDSSDYESSDRDLQQLEVQKILPGLAQLSVICNQVARYGIGLAAKVAERKASGSAGNSRSTPASYPSDLQPQLSRPSSHGSTPEKNRPKTQKDGKRSAKETKTQFLEIEGTTCVMIRKRKSLNEIEMLKKLRGSMHVVELFHSYAYSKLNEMVLFEEALEPMDPYRQIPDYLNCSSLVHGYCIQFLLDMVSALDFLKKQRIIHRDISTRNLMFSPFLNVWKLIDFETAISLSSHSHDDDVCKDSFHGGTRAYSAPEFALNESYDYSVDAYSLGQVYLQALDADIVVYAVTDSNADRFSISLCNVASGLAKKEKSNRMPLEAANDRLLKLLPKMRTFYREEPFDTEQPDILESYPRLNHYLDLLGIDNFPSRNRITQEIERQVKDHGLYYIPDRHDGDIETVEDDEVGDIGSKENLAPSNNDHPSSKIFLNSRYSR